MNYTQRQEDTEFIALPYETKTQTPWSPVIFPTDSYGILCFYVSAFI